MYSCVRRKVMFCSNCGTELKVGLFCPNCGKKIGSTPENQIANSYVAPTGYAPKNTISNKNRNIILSVVGGVTILIIAVFVLGHGKSKDNDTVPFYSAPYSDTQGQLSPSDGFSNGNSGYSVYDPYDSYVSDDSYDYSDTKRICPSCNGSGTCPICNGTGEYSMYGMDYSTCTACGGTGTCSICGGVGYY